ncbi:MAG: hypothetical protein QXP01_06230 [Candidatus Hadarchaeum sp.]
MREARRRRREKIKAEKKPRRYFSGDPVMLTKELTEPRSCPQTRSGSGHWEPELIRSCPDRRIEQTRIPATAS